MAKCVQNPKTKEARRTSDEEAAKLVQNGWKYIGKFEMRRMLQATQQEKAVGQ